jgi:hypothetical protein
LDDSVAPHVKTYTTQHLTPAQRLPHYSFENSQKFDHWIKFHQSMDETQIDQYQKQYPTIVKRVHPGDFAYGSDCVYYMAKLDYSEFASYWLVKTKELWCGFPVVRPGEIQQEIELEQQLKPTIIDVNKFLNQSTWQEEYIRINNHMQLPIQLDTATRLYQSWYKYRVAPLKQMFEQLSSIEKQSSIQTRLDHEKNGQPSPWWYVYNRIKDQSWPDCNTEQDFVNLPDSIQQEVIQNLGPHFIFEKLDRTF